jgi:hypothetical protein
VKLLPVKEIEDDSRAAIAPPHARHTDTFNVQAAELREKALDETLNALATAPMAPPIRAVLFSKKQLVITTVLELMDRAPPIPFDTMRLEQLRKEIPEIETVVFDIMNAGPPAPRQSKTAPLGALDMLKTEASLLRNMLGSENLSLARKIEVASLCRTAYWMDLQGRVRLHDGMSCPITGFTDTETPTASTILQ